YIRPKRDDAIDWWAAYQIGQRVCPEFIVKDTTGACRVLTIGDGAIKLAHTHSPKAGQGMNVSMMDSYNLAWKLAYHVNGLTPSTSGNALLDTYNIERHANAQQLIDFDGKFSTGFSDKVGTADSKSGISHAEFVDMFSTGCEFTSGCGVEYVENLAVDRTPSPGTAKPVVSGHDYLSGILRPGHRLLNVKMKRFADGAHRDIHDDLASTERFRILSLLSVDLLDPDGVSATALKGVAGLVQQFPPLLLEQIVVYPELPSIVSWANKPSFVKEHAEMAFYSGYEVADAYGIYGVDPAQGALLVVRPDGYVGMVAPLGEVARVGEYLGGIMARVA
ncbi:thioredoxin-like protein, partial [Aspergillus uvarum CBS 121591]